MQCKIWLNKQTNKNFKRNIVPASMENSMGPVVGWPREHVVWQGECYGPKLPASFIPVWLAAWFRYQSCNVTSVKYALASRAKYIFFKVIKLTGVHITLKFPCSVCAPVLTSIKTLVTPTTYISLAALEKLFLFLFHFCLMVSVS